MEAEEKRPRRKTMRKGKKDPNLPTPDHLVALEKLYFIYEMSDHTGREGQYALVYRGKLQGFFEKRQHAHRVATKKLSPTEDYLVHRVPGMPIREEIRDDVEGETMQ